jgi:hypothetical protein
MFASAQLHIISILPRLLFCATKAANFLVIMFALVAPSAAVSHDAILTVDGQNLHMETLGESGPTIVRALGADSSTWKPITGPIAKFARVVLYDRAGLGQSLPMTNKDSPITADQVAIKLRQLLAIADIPPPYMLVGHSLGGLYVHCEKVSK